MVAIGGDLPKIDLIKTVRVLGKQSTPDLSDVVRSAPRAGKRPCPGQRRDSPINAVSKALLTGIEDLIPLLVGEPDVLRDPVLDFAGLSRLTIPKHLQHGEQEAIPCRHLTNGSRYITHARQVIRATDEGRSSVRSPLTGVRPCQSDAGANRSSR